MSLKDKFNLEKLMGFCASKGTDWFVMPIRRMLLSPLLSLMLFAFVALSSTPCFAQPVSWVQTDIGNPGATGTYNFSSGTYTIAGAGTGVGPGSTDSFTYVSVPTSGNIEMVARVVSQTNTSNYATAGLMIRSSLNSNAIEAMVAVSPANGVNFFYRPTDGTATSTTLGPSITAPIWLRLVRSQNSIASYQSSDGISWQLVGQTQITLPPKYYIGFAVSSNSFGNLSTAVFNQVNYMTSVPQRNANLITWLRADIGVLSSSGQVSGWLDQSELGNNAAQGTSANKPTLVTGAINGLPALSFNGNSQYMVLPAGYSDFTAGASIFIVAKPTTGTLGARFLDLDTGSPPNNSLGVSVNSTTANNVFVFSGSTPSILSGSTTLNQFQLMEGIQNGAAGTGSLYNNGILTSGTPPTSLSAIPNVSRPINLIGEYAGGGSSLQGQIAEILIYKTALTAAQRKDIESYIYSKYAIGNQPTLDAPTISPSNNVFSTPTQSVSITQNVGAQIYYTTDGSTPVPGTSPLYTGAFNVSASTTVKAIAAAPFYSNSAVATSFIQYDPAAAGVSRTGLQAWYKADNTVTTSGSNVTQWADVSGNAKNAFQNNSINRPTLVSSGPNGLPTINFTPGANGQFLQIPAGFSDFTAGTSMFIVTKPTAVNIVGARFLDLGTGSSADSLGLNAISNTADQFFVINGSTVHTANGNMTLNQYQLLETVQGASSAFVYTNGVLAPGMPVSVQNPTNTNRTSNFIGQYTGGGYYVQGEIAEILIYNRSLTATERSNVENYLMTRYALGVKAPVITVDSPSTAIYTTPKTISISAAPGAQIFYTLNGTTPSATSTSSILYTGPFVVAKPTTIKAIAVQSFGTSAVSTLTLLIDLNADAVMQPGPFTWLRSDMGVGISSGSSVNSWLDVTGNGRTAGSSGAAQPTLVNNAINGLPAVSFNGGNSYMQFPSTDANFSTGVSIFVVANCNSVNQAGDRFIEFSTGSGTNAIALYANSSTSDAYFTSVGASGSGVAGNMTTNEYQLLEAMQDGAGWVGMYRNGVFGPAAAQLPLPPHPINRNVNYVGQYSGGGFFLQGQTAEIIVFNKALSPGQRAAIEGYLLNKYQFSLQKPAAPIISVPTSTLGGPTQVAIAAQPGATIYFTTDGSQPSTASPVYQGPVNVYFTQTLKTIAVRNGIQSAVSSATYTLNSTQWPTPDAFDPTQLQIQLQQPTNGVLQ